MRTVTTLAAAVLALVLAESPFAAEGEAPAGPVVLTIAENVANTNRPAYREKLDVIFRYHKRTFDLAFAFDRAMLEGMGTVALRIEHAGWGGPMTVSGPRLADVLKMAGCPGGPLATLALDGFNTEISGEEREAHEWVVATRAEGRPLGLGERARSGSSSIRRTSGRPPTRRRTSGRGRFSSSSASKDGYSANRTARIRVAPGRPSPPGAMHPTSGRAAAFRRRRDPADNGISTGGLAASHIVEGLTFRMRLATCVGLFGCHYCGSRAAGFAPQPLLRSESRLRRFRLISGQAGGTAAARVAFPAERMDIAYAIWRNE